MLEEMHLVALDDVAADVVDDFALPVSTHYLYYYDRVVVLWPPEDVGWEHAIVARE